MSRSRLISAPKSIRGDLEIVYQGDVVEDPCLLAIEIANVGRIGISSGSFDQGRGIVFDLNQEIVKVLNVERTPDSAPMPEIVSDRSKIELRPELIGAGEIITAVLLTVGPVSGIELAFSSLADVKVEIRDREAWEQRRTRRLGRIGAVLVGSVLAGALLSPIVLLGNSLEKNAGLSGTVSLARASVCSDVDLSADNYDIALSGVFIRIRPARHKAGLSVVLPSDYKSLIRSLDSQRFTALSASDNATAIGVKLPRLMALRRSYAQVAADLDGLAKVPTISRLLILGSDVVSADRVTSKITAECKAYL